MIIIALLLDILFGDPKNKYHPVAYLGKLISVLDGILNRGRFLRVKGLILVAIILLITYFSVYLIVDVASSYNAFLGSLVSALIIWLSISVKGLAIRASDIKTSLSVDNLINARKLVSQIVGRDTARLSNKEISRATVESVIENTVDSITSPIFYALLFGPVGAFAYRAVNTLDSMVGYKNNKYKNFGWASAKLDDIANFIPARITALIVAIISFIFGSNFKSTILSILRYSKNHSSPNAGLIEAAAAGALNIRIGGENYYNGVLVNHGHIGSGSPVKVHDIQRAVHLMWVSCFVFTGFCIALFALIGGIV